MSELAVSTRTVGQATVVEVAGTIDTTSCGKLDIVIEDIIRKQPGRVVIDMGRVGFVNSAGWGMLLEKAEKIVSMGGKMLLAGMQEDVEEIFQLLGLSKLVGHTQSLDDALEADVRAGMST
jgi:anti-sigma B factor antagonist